jgi:hypothetical protein
MPQLQQLRDALLTKLKPLYSHKFFHGDKKIPETVVEAIMAALKHQDMVKLTSFTHLSNTL